MFELFACGPRRPSVKLWWMSRRKCHLQKSHSTYNFLIVGHFWWWIWTRRWLASADLHTWACSLHRQGLWSCGLGPVVFLPTFTKTWKDPLSPSYNHRTECKAFCVVFTCESLVKLFIDLMQSVNLPTCRFFISVPLWLLCVCINKQLLHKITKVAFKHTNNLYLSFFSCTVNHTVTVLVKNMRI